MGAAGALSREEQHALVLDHDAVARTLASIYRRTWVDRYGAMADQEDLVQIARVGLIEAAARFDPSRGVSFKTFAWRYACGHILHYLRRGGAVHMIRQPRRRRQDRAERAVDIVSVDDRLSARMLGSLCRTEPGFAEAEARADILRALRDAGPLVVRVVSERMRDRTQARIAREMGISQRHVSRLLLRAMDALRRAGVVA